MKIKEWREESISLQKIGLKIRKANLIGKEIPMNVFVKMQKILTTREISFLETYLFFVSEGNTGANYLTQEEMELVIKKGNKKLKRRK